MLSNAFNQFLSRGFLHFDVGKEFLACILQAYPIQIDYIVDNQEAIMIALAERHSDGRILCIVPSPYLPFEPSRKP